MEVLHRFCCLFCCQLGDLLEYVPDDKENSAGAKLCEGGCDADLNEAVMEASPKRDSLH
ncbi:MAG: helix-turn-helix domain-containing protein [Desulfitobacteriaceae bacterium]